MLRNNFLVIGLCAGLVACGGGSSSSDDGASQDQPNTQTGVFLDSPVINIGYRTESFEGVTNLSGEYDYLEGETVTFFIGDLELPPVTASGVVTPLDIADSQNTSDTTVVNIIRLLQTLDEDGDPDNGISITDTAKSSATQVDFGLSVEDFAASTAITALVPNSGSTNMALISANDAISHFEQQLKNNDISFGELNGAWEVPSESAIFMFLPDDRYFAIQWEEENGFIGFERGTYAEGETEITFDTLQNDDGEALICNPKLSNANCSGEAVGFSLSGDELTLVDPNDVDPVVFQRKQFSDDALQGAWELPNESAIFMFLPDGRYFAIQWEEENGFIGFERGIYAEGETEITFDTLQNDDGEALVCDQPAGTTCSGEVVSFSLSGDELTLDPSDVGFVTFEKLF